jgi:outer membrane receptor for ferrienterochelin and colicins
MAHVFYAILVCCVSTTLIYAQQTMLRGIVYNGSTTEVLRGITVVNQATNTKVATNNKGEFTISNKGTSAQLVIRGIGFVTIDTIITADRLNALIEVRMTESYRELGEVIVFGASRRAEKLTEAPAAISTVAPIDIERASAHGQVARTLETFAGIDVNQGGANDFNVNARGFNNSINRRMLVLIDGRDPSTPLINLNEWNSVSSLLEDISSVEVVHGPGSALYGPNAYNGVVSIRTSAPKDVLGTKVSATAGEWETYRLNVRHAGQMDNLTYKVTAGASQQLNYSLVSRLRDSTKPNLGLEYSGLAFDVRPLTEEARRPYSYVATARFDYDLGENNTVLVEGGMSHSGNDFYVNQTGRILIQEINRPFVRAAFNNTNVNVQALWQRRFAPLAQLVYNAQATSGEQSDVFNVDAQWNDRFYDNTLHVVVGANAERQNILSGGYHGIAPLISPDSVFGNFLGAYVQAEYKVFSNVKAVGALRVDGSNIFETQLSPKIGLVFEPSESSSVRLTYNRAFLRPSFADLYRKSPAGPPQQFAALGSRVDSITSSIVGRQVSANLGLASTNQWNLGNPTLQPEAAQSFELGYKGQLGNFFLEFAGYYNRRTDLISAPLGGLAPNVYAPVRANTGDDVVNQVADSVLTAELRKINPLFPSRLAMYQGAPALVIVPTNIAIVNEIGAEVSATYQLNRELSVFANWTYIDVAVQDNDVPSQTILPNTARHRINSGIEYVDDKNVDVAVHLRYTEGFNWIAGLFNGFVPAYAVVNLNAGYYPMANLRVGLQVFNLLNREHYQIFGGNILQRQTSLTVQYSF